MLKKELKLESLTKNQVNDISNLIDVNQVVGTPIKFNDELTVVPVLKVVVGYLNGGGEYGQINLFSKDKSKPVVTGGGAIVNMHPSGFLIIKNNVTNFLKISEDMVDSLFDKTTQFLNNTINENN